MLGSKVLFAGEDANGHVNLWETDGTSAGTSELAVGGAPSSGLLSGADHDFTVLGSKVLFQGGGPDFGLWITDGTAAGTSELTVAGASSFGLTPSDITVFAAATTAPQGDFNGDGTSDILLQNSSGNLVDWELNGTSVIGTAIVTNPGPSWHVVGTGDYNGDGFSDIRLQNSSGKAFIWEMNGTNIIGSGSVGSNPGPSWH